ncbi:transposase zinc-binding domain-containing protein [Rhodoferax antarcticus]|uniref:Transposase n=1 Tax=Rhodoferax antarcticus ANT.BR TaxID=1111071 RepID=A0A1Q8YFE9_9BURK|nr:transposase zinc-binding domain-containing protein [Rhodoferax antarcticus]APW46398.1 hypothetical protein RA876_08420 [Rhodoferax antarcticus]OLP06639.1 transposase [Rhodoferax antarcticus ANT.BR]
MQGPPHPSPQRFHPHSRGHQHAPLRPQPAQAAAATKSTKAYNPRHPERTLLYRTIAEHFETWLELSSAGQFDGQGDNHTPPAYVEKAFRKYLECGIFAHGFARVRCDDCGDDFLVAFSCKGRGVCPSCNTQRCASSSGWCVHACCPIAPVRHSVTPPVCTWARLPCVHRFGSSLNTQVHFHVCVVDGVFETVAGPIAQSVDAAAAQANPAPQSVIFHAATGLDEAAVCPGAGQRAQTHPARAHPLPWIGSNSAPLSWSTAVAKGTQSPYSPTNILVNWCSRHWN